MQAHCTYVQKNAFIIINATIELEIIVVRISSNIIEDASEFVENFRSIDNVNASQLRVNAEIACLASLGITYFTFESLPRNVSRFTVLRIFRSLTK